MDRWRAIPAVFLFAVVLGAPGAPAKAGCRTDAAQMVFVGQGKDSAQNPAFSPDGQTLLFTVFHRGYNLGDAGVFTTSVGGGVPVALLDEGGQTAVNLPGTSWNGTTNRIVVSSDRLDTDEIWTMAPDGTGLARVTQQSAPFVHNQEPSFSPDGQWLVFEAVGDGPEPALRGSIWKVRSDGSSLTQLVDGAATDTDNRQPNWSPPGARILFQRRVGSSPVWNLYTMAADGSGVVQITTGNSDTDAAWSPDGQWIVYSSDFGGLAVANIFAVPVTGGTPVRVTNQTINEDSAPSWSPDGKWIAFESHPPDDRTAAALWRIRVPVPFGSCLPAGAPCDDADPCTSNDICQGSVCTGTPAGGIPCDDGNPCTRNDVCQVGVCGGVATPLTGCRRPVSSGKAFLLLRDAASDAGDKIVWRWRSGAATTRSEFGSPATATDYTMCVYDQQAGADHLVMWHRIAAGSAWKEQRRGFRFRDRRQSGDGIGRVRLREGSDGHAKVVVSGRGACLGMTTLPLAQDTTVRVQLDNGTTCWEARYGTNLENAPNLFRARAD